MNIFNSRDCTIQADDYDVSLGVSRYLQQGLKDAGHVLCVQNNHYQMTNHFLIYL